MPPPSTGAAAATVKKEEPTEEKLIGKKRELTPDSKDHVEESAQKRPKLEEDQDASDSDGLFKTEQPQEPKKED